MKICWIYRLLLLVFCRDIVDPVIDFFHLLFEALIVTLQASFFFQRNNKGYLLYLKQLDNSFDKIVL